MTQWCLPESATFGGVEYAINADYRDVLEIISYLNDVNTPDWLKWQIALALFYDEEIPEIYQAEAMNFLSEFIACGEDEETPGPKLIDWDHDATAIVADVNKVAGMEVRSVPFLHWWTFIAFFRAIGEGQLATLVSIRQKLAKGKALEKWEQDFYVSNKSRVDLPKYYTSAELREREELNKLLGE